MADRPAVGFGVDVLERVTSRSMDSVSRRLS
jgi:hypothetical protein